MRTEPLKTVPITSMLLWGRVRGGLCGLSFVVAVLGLWLLPGCRTNPATGETNLNAFSTEEEIAIGEEAGPQFLEQNGGVIPAAGVNRYVTRIASRLAAASERPELPWEFTVLDSAQVNAFALPGGKVFVSRGLLVGMENEAQLAAVLGHEIGHVTSQHGARQMTRAAGLSAIAQAIGLAAQASDEELMQYAGIAVGAGGNLYLLSYGRGQELEADSLGIRYMTRLGYDPQGMVQLLQILDSGSGNPGWSEFLSTHPDPGRRIDDAKQRIASEYPTPAGGWKRGFAPRPFRANVLQPIAQLPPPKHNPAAASQSSGSLDGHGAEAAEAVRVALRRSVRDSLREHGVAVVPRELMTRDGEHGADHAGGGSHDHEVLVLVDTRRW